MMDALHETVLSCALCCAFGVNRRMKLFSTAGREGVCTWPLVSRAACIVKSPARNTPLPLIRPHPYLRQNFHSRWPLLRCRRLTPLLFLAWLLTGRLLIGVFLLSTVSNVRPLLDVASSCEISPLATLTVREGNTLVLGRFDRIGTAAVAAAAAVNVIEIADCKRLRLGLLL